MKQFGEAVEMALGKDRKDFDLDDLVKALQDKSDMMQDMPERVNMQALEGYIRENGPYYSVSGLMMMVQMFYMDYMMDEF